MCPSDLTHMETQKQPPSKWCFKCKTTKPVEEFYRHPKMADGRLGKCKTCTKADVKTHYRATLPERKAYEKRRSQETMRKAAVARYQRKRRDLHPEKTAARDAVANALRDGRLVKGPCKECGAADVQAHHHDYSKPLDVEWLCFRCHRNERHGQHVTD